MSSAGNAAAQAIVEIVRGIPSEHLTLFCKILQNVVKDPSEAKFRKLNLSNAKVKNLTSAAGAYNALMMLGWTVVGEELILPESVDLAPWKIVLEQVESSGGSSSSSAGRQLCADAGEKMTVTILRGTSKVQLELPQAGSVADLRAAIQQHSSLGGIPPARQNLLVGYPPQPLEERFPAHASMRLAELAAAKAIKLEDRWEELLSNLQAGKASFKEMAPILLAGALPLRDYREFLFDCVRSMLRTPAASWGFDDIVAARRCLQVLWPQGESSTFSARLAFCSECAGLAKPPPLPEGDESEAAPVACLHLEVDRANLFEDAIRAVGSVAQSDLRRPLRPEFKGEAAEDAGGPRREFFNEFGKGASKAAQAWRVTAAGSLAPALVPLNPEVIRSCGRVFGLALCQAENAAQEQRLREGGTLADLLAAVRAPAAGEQAQWQRLLIGVPLATSFVRLVQGDPPETLDELQAELRREQSESSPDVRGGSALFQKSLAELGLEGQLSFSVIDVAGQEQDLIPDGRAVPVTDANKIDWLHKALHYELVDRQAPAAEAFRIGVCEAGCLPFLVLLSAAELVTVWAGAGLIDDEALHLWQSKATVNPARKQQATWFFELLSVELKQMRERVLKFTTGSDRWPADTSDFRFCIEPLDGGDNSLPQAMTCGNMLQLPLYSSRECLHMQLIKACEMGVTMELA